MHRRQIADAKTLWGFTQRLEAEGREGNFTEDPRQRIEQNERAEEFDTNQTMGR